MSTIAPPRPLRAADVPEACAMLAAAFHDDPASRFLLPDERSRDRWLRLIHRANLRQLLPAGEVYSAAGVAGIIGLVAPGRYPLPAGRFLLQLALLVARLPSGGFPLGKALRAIQAQRAIDRLHIRERHWYVPALGVQPQRQGNGLGRALLEPTLALADHDRLPVYLETANESNLTFYRHFGFEIERETAIPGGGPPIWTMLRPPVG